MEFRYKGKAVHVKNQQEATNLLIEANEHGYMWQGDRKIDISENLKFEVYYFDSACDHRITHGAFRNVDTERLVEFEYREVKKVKFQVNDVVECIEVSGVGYAGIIGKHYVIEKLKDDHLVFYNIDTDIKNNCGSSPKRFKLVKRGGNTMKTLTFKEFSKNESWILATTSKQKEIRRKWLASFDYRFLRSCSMVDELLCDSGGTNIEKLTDSSTTNNMQIYSVYQLEAPKVKVKEMTVAEIEKVLGHSVKVIK